MDGSCRARSALPTASVAPLFSSRDVLLQRASATSSSLLSMGSLLCCFALCDRKRVPGLKGFASRRVSSVAPAKLVWASRRGPCAPSQTGVPPRFDWTWTAVVRQPAFILSIPSTRISQRIDDQNVSRDKMAL